MAKSDREKWPSWVGLCPFLAGSPAIHGSRSEFEFPSIHTTSPETLMSLVQPVPARRDSRARTSHVTVGAEFQSIINQTRLMMVTTLTLLDGPLSAPPLTRGMWATTNTSMVVGWNEGIRDTRGDPDSGRPVSCVVSVLLSPPPLMTAPPR